MNPRPESRQTMPLRAYSVFYTLGTAGRKAVLLSCRFGSRPLRQQRESGTSLQIASGPTLQARSVDVGPISGREGVVAIRYYNLHRVLRGLDATSARHIVRKAPVESSRPPNVVTTYLAAGSASYVLVDQFAG